MAIYGPYLMPWLSPGSGPTPPTPPTPTDPYTELEYIHFSGSEWLDTGRKASWFFDTSAEGIQGARQIGVKLSFPSGQFTYSSSRWAFGVYDTSLADASRRFLFGQTMSDYGTQLRIRPMALGAGSGSGLPPEYNVDKGSPIEAAIYFYKNGANSYAQTYALQGGSYIVNGALGTQYNQTISDLNVWIGGRNRSGALDAAITQLNVYSFSVHDGVSRTDYKAVRRNSDGVCGLLSGSDFIPMQGANITYASGAGGPEAN